MTLDAALDQGSNDAIVADHAEHAILRVGGGIRSTERALDLLDNGVHRVIIGTAAFTPDGINRPLLESLPPDRVILALDSKEGKAVTRGWREATRFSAEVVIASLEPYCSGFLCTYVDKEGMMEGTDLEWFRRLRAATRHEITAAGGISTLDEIRALDANGHPRRAGHGRLYRPVAAGRAGPAGLVPVRRDLSPRRALSPALLMVSTRSRTYSS